jgi:enoyl-CoA hydratase/carnithine racemase
VSFEYRIEDNIVIFLLKNGKPNAITLEALEGLRHIIDRLNNETDLKGMVISGTGKYFSSGFDLDTFTSFANNQAIIDWFKVEEEALYQLLTCSKPVVAAVNGTATVAGMIVSCDYRMIVNNPKIKLGMTEIKLSLALSPAKVEIMRFGLDTDKKFRDVILMSLQKVIKR